MQGELVVELPCGGELSPEGLVDESSVKEVSRETKSVTDGTNVQEYDVVTYQFEQAKIKANVNNVYEELQDAVQWGYSTMVASLEVWNRGVWMELKTLLDDPCMGTYIQPGESAEYLGSQALTEMVPYHASGIYRIVVHGAFEDVDTYAATESFVIE